MKIYGLYNPARRLIGVFNDNWAAWVCAFDWQDDEFRRKFWKRVTPSRRAMIQRGWRVATGKFKPDTEVRK